MYAVVTFYKQGEVGVGCPQGICDHATLTYTPKDHATLTHLHL